MVPSRPLLWALSPKEDESHSRAKCGLPSPRPFLAREGDLELGRADRERELEAGALAGSLTAA